MRYSLGRRHSAGLRSGRINLLATGTRRAFGKSLFNTGILLYLVGIGVLLLLGVVSSSETSRARRRMRRQYCMKNTGS